MIYWTGSTYKFLAYQEDLYMLFWGHDLLTRFHQYCSKLTRKIFTWSSEAMIYWPVSTGIVPSLQGRSLHGLLRPWSIDQFLPVLFLSYQEDLYMVFWGHDLLTSFYRYRSQLTMISTWSSGVMIYWPVSTVIVPSLPRSFHGLLRPWSINGNNDSWYPLSLTYR